jgi:multiple sugar transport system ATP-binding protein
MAKVTLRNVTKRFGKVVAVKDLNLEIADGEFVVFVGPSGCGKTTTLRMIAGLEDIEEGEIYIGERLVNDLPPKDRNIAMVFQNYALYPHMNVYRNMAFGLKLRRVPKEEIDRRVSSAAKILGLEDLLERKPKQLSGGQMQRVAVGRAIVRDPDVFLFDEPLSNLDAKLRVQMRNEISKLHNQLGTTMVYVTHDQVEAMTMGDRIVIMKDGLVQQVGSPLEVYERPQNLFVAGFIGSPTMNFLHGTLIRMEGVLWFKAGEWEFQIPPGRENSVHSAEGRPAVLGIRPDHVGLIQEPLKSPDVIRAKVEVVETLGSETLVSGSSGEISIMAKVMGVPPVRFGDGVCFKLDMSNAHVFDRDSGICLTSGHEEALKY